MAVTVFNERGFDGTSVDELSRRLGLSKSAIYHHVEGKEALLGMALDRALTSLEEVADEVRGLDGPAVERLEALLRASVGVLVDQLPYVTLLLRVRGNSPTERDALVRRRRIDAMVADLVKQAVGDGELRPDIDPLITARLLFGTVNSLTEWLKADQDHDEAKLADAVSSIVFDGLRVRS